MENQTLADKELLPIINNDTLKLISKSFSEGKFDVVIANLGKDEILTKLNAPNLKLSKQIVLSIYIYCLLKQNKKEDVKKIYQHLEIKQSDMIFPLIFLKAKIYSLPDLSQSAVIYHEMLTRYESYNSQEKPQGDIITIETYNSEFTYFQNFFLSLFYINNIEVKIKKIYFELKLTLNQMGFLNDAYNLIEGMYTKYPNDIKVQFELAKDSLILSKIDKYNQLVTAMRENAKSVENDLYLSNIYNTFITYAEILFVISKGEFEEAKKKFTEMLSNDPENILLVNNISILNLFENNVTPCYENLKKFATQMDCLNDIIKHNLNLMADLFKFSKIN